MMMRFSELNTPLRTIMTPGPVEVDPRVLRAMSNPILGQFDPAFTAIMNDVMVMIQQVFQTSNNWAYPVDGTSRSGLEAVLASIIVPGDKVLIPIYGRFGHLLTEIAERYGAEIHTLDCEWGEVFDPDLIIQEMKKVQPKIVALVHGETSTGRMQPLEEIGRACREQDILFVVDAVATIGGADVQTDKWFIDAAIGGNQKCLSVPSGHSPITYNKRIEKVLLQRKKVERGIATDSELDELRNTPFIRSNYLDLAQLQDYWSPRRLNHHTEATSMLYALHEGLRIVLEEGLDHRFARHKYHEQALLKGLEGMELQLFGDIHSKLPTVTCVKVPVGVDAESIRHMMLQQFGVEIASSFGPLHGKIWRIGTMGYSCRKENILYVLASLEACLIRHGVNIPAGEALQATLDYYLKEKEGVMLD